jgi:hypothetical protein
LTPDVILIVFLPALVVPPKMEEKTVILSVCLIAVAFSLLIEGFTMSQSLPRQMVSDEVMSSRSAIPQSIQSCFLRPLLTGCGTKPKTVVPILRILCWAKAIPAISSHCWRQPSLYINAKAGL